MAGRSFPDVTGLGFEDRTEDVLILHLPVSETDALDIFWVPTKYYIAALRPLRGAGTRTLSGTGGDREEVWIPPEGRSRQ